MNEEEYSKFIEEYTTVMTTDKGTSASSRSDFSEESLEMKSLFTLANSVESVLVPVKAPSFRASLGQRLALRQEDKPKFRALATRQNVVWMAVAAAGSFISIAGVVLLVIKKLKNTGRREQTTAAASI
ncbi:MAG TPA: hypothetical protein VFI27_20485 [candidate division Zixibacteria bacterium]|nr:hypothetical protein [candidate division Zixibacteria bacterium]